MNVNLPHDIDEFVKGLVLAGQFSSEEEVITESLRMLRSNQQLRSDVAEGFKQIGEGNWIDGDVMFRELHATVGAIEAQKHQGP